MHAILYGEDVCDRNGDSIIRLSHWQLKEALFSCVEKGSGSDDFVLPSICVATKLCSVSLGVIPNANSTKKMPAKIRRMVADFARVVLLRCCKSREF